MRATLQKDVSHDSPEMPFQALHRQSGITIECPAGAVVQLRPLLGQNATRFAKEHLLAESIFRDQFLAGERRLRRQHGWTFYGLRRVTMLDFAAGADRSGDLALHTLGMARILNRVIRSGASRVCPICHKPLAEALTLPAQEELLQGAQGSIAVCIPLSGSAADFHERGYDTCLSEGRKTQLASLKQNQLGECWVILDTLRAEKEQLSRFQQALELAESMQPQKIGIFELEQNTAREKRIIAIGRTCPDGHFTAEEINIDSIGRIPAGERALLLESCLLEDRSVFELLNKPLSQITFPCLDRVSGLIRRSCSGIIASAFTLLTPAENLSLPDLQTLKIIRLLIEEITDSVLVVEEPMVAADEVRCTALGQLLGELAANRNRVLVIDSSTAADRRSHAPAGASSVDSEELKKRLVPGRKIIDWSHDPGALKEILQQIDGRELTPPAAILELPELRTLHASSRTIAEIIGLIAPLTALYQQLPLAKRYGLTSAQLFNPPSRETIPLFKGISPAQALHLSVRQASEIFGQIPACARPLEMLAQLGLESLQLDRPASALSLGELNRVRLSQINCRPAKLRRIYMVDYPLCGLDSESTAPVRRLFDQLVSAGHTLIATDRHRLLSDWCDECLKFDSQEATL